MITIELQGDKELLMRFASMPAKLRDALTRKMHVITQEVRNYIVTDKLSGQVLNKRSGNLQRSITAEVTSTDTSVTGRVFSAGDVKYAAIHEFGGTIEHPGGTAYFIGKDGKAVFVSNAIAFAYGSWARTKAHAIKMPKRSFMISSLTDKKDSIRDQLQAAVNEAIK